MKRLVPMLACACAALGLAGSAPAGLSVGVNDDVGKLSALAPWAYSTMQSTGLTVNTLTLAWDDTDPTAIPASAEVAAAVATAESDGVTIEFDLYPAHSQVFTGGVKCAVSTNPLACGNSTKIAQFAAWAASVAQTFPTVHQFVVMNECNQPLFVNPQWDAGSQNQSARICGRALAAAYDAIKGVSSTNFVWGVGLSPRGNDNAHASTNSSTSPVRFLANLGAWFKEFAKATHRTAPLMDGFDFHPYPVPQSLSFAKGYPNPNDAAVSNLPRIYQAFYDAFNGSPQKTIGQQSGGGLPVSLNEVGIQTEPNSNEYSGIEVSSGAGGVHGQFASADYQAKWYYDMLQLVSCDPNVRVVNIFHLLDESTLAGWQSGLFYADQTPKQSADMIHAWIASTGGRCQGKTVSWQPTTAASTITTTTTETKKPKKEKEKEKKGNK